jgi:hypothetical protein
MRKIIKTFWLCPNCGSDRVQQKSWINLNDNSIDSDSSSDLNDEEDFYCQDCEEHHVPYTAELKVSHAKIIGFQVVSDDEKGNIGDIHPNMAGSFCIYSLSQAKEMLEDGWRLLCIRKGDVEEPTFMFKGDPRE